MAQAATTPAVNGSANHPNGTSSLPNGSAKPSKYSTRDLPSHFIGGNRLEVAPASKVKEFVTANGGHTVITSVCEAIKDSTRKLVN